MYINDLGIDRIGSTGSVKRVAPVDHKGVFTGTRRAGAVRGNRTQSFSSVLGKAVESERMPANIPTFASAGDIIIREAFRKMENDPEWEESVMGKVKEYYAGEYEADDTVRGWQYPTGQNGLQSYLLQGLYGAAGIPGLTGYSAYGLGNQALTAYGNVMNGALSSSLFGSWQL